MGPSLETVVGLSVHGGFESLPLRSRGRRANPAAAGWPLAKRANGHPVDRSGGVWLAGARVPLGDEAAAQDRANSTEDAGAHCAECPAGSSQVQAERVVERPVACADGGECE